ncbi:type II toxin-antitoxin system RelE/ParE family toxin [Phenylobacterium sp.]|uniref:type II toxin-antitoxin system RelE/ParE family toxin n=1 Tax=Phenylobacterium sp. TaxID=1871053 RepID=UPI0035C79E25
MTRKVRLTPAAEQDIADLLDRSADQFGDAGRDRYEHLLETALRALAEGHPNGSRERPELGPGLFAYHLRHSRGRARLGGGRAVGRPRHFLIYRHPSHDLVLVLRVLYDAMDLARHVEDDPPGP